MMHTFAVYYVENMVYGVFCNPSSGNTAYVVSWNRASDTFKKYDLASVVKDTAFLNDLVVSRDQKMAYVTDCNSAQVYALDLTTGNVV